MTNEQEMLIKEFISLSPTPTYDLYLRYCSFHGVEPVGKDKFEEVSLKYKNVVG